MKSFQNPSCKSERSKRYRATINIPDDAFALIVHGNAPVEEVEEVKEVDKD